MLFHVWCIGMKSQSFFAICLQRTFRFPSRRTSLKRSQTLDDRLYLLIPAPESESDMASWSARTRSRPHTPTGNRADQQNKQQYDAHDEAYTSGLGVHGCQLFASVATLGTRFFEKNALDRAGHAETEYKLFLLRHNVCSYRCCTSILGTIWA